MMIYIENDSKDAAFHFSAEEYLMRNFQSDNPIIMIWQAEKCAMLGNYQVASAEVNLGYAEREEIKIVRRSSGGGTIFCDLGTFLYTVILPFSGNHESARGEVAGIIVRALNKIGVPARIEGRNDILAGGKKISGIAQHAGSGKICTHGSLLYDTDLDMLTQTLNVDEDKIRSKAIHSVRSRVANIRQYMENLSALEFQELLKSAIFEIHDVKEYIFSSHEIQAINIIREKKYASPSWTFGSSPPFSLYNSIRFPAGKIEVYLEITKGDIVSCSIRGDFLGIVPIRELEEQLEQKTFQYQAIANYLESVNLAPYLGDITKDQLLSCIFN